MEDPTIQKLIGFTLSPKPQKCNANKELFLIWSLKIHWALKQFSKDYTYYHEFDDTGRLHFHGWLKPYDIIKFKRNQGHLRKLGFCKFETKFKSFANWQTYCKKSLEETLRIYEDVNPKYLPMTPDTVKQLQADIKEEQHKESTTWLQRNMKCFE